MQNVVWGAAALSLAPNPKALNLSPYKKSRPLATRKGVYLPLLPGTVGHEEWSGGVCWPRGCARRSYGAFRGRAWLLSFPDWKHYEALSPLTRCLRS